MSGNSETIEGLDGYKTEDLIREFLNRVCPLPSNHPHLKDTPKRFVKMHGELLKGYQEPDFEFTTFPIEEGEVPSLVIVCDIPYFSLCSHHLVIFAGKAHIAYLPQGKLCGLSKLARVAHYFAARLQLQEQLTNQVADFLVEHLRPDGLGVVVEGEHFCMAARGVKVSGHRTVTSAMRGKMIRNEGGLKDEFFNIIHHGS